MKRFVALLLCILFAILSFPVYATGIDVSASYAALINADTGELLWGKQADVPRGMASTTKIMTGLLAIESLPFSQVIEVASEAIGVEGSSMYLQRGEHITAEALIYGLLLQSANDAAVAIACAVSGSVSAFVERMNQRAAELGLTNTHFENPHGLWAAEHVTTARELALLTAAALQNPLFAKVVSTYRRTFVTEDGKMTRVFLNHNRLLRQYADCIGVKTGFTKKTGRCLVSAAKRNGLTLIAVTLQAPNDWQDHKSMLDLGFSLYEDSLVIEPGACMYTVPVVNSTQKQIVCKNADGIVLHRRKGTPSIKTVVEMERFYFGGISAGSKVGLVAFYQDGKRIGEIPIYATESAGNIVYKKGFWEKMLHR